MCLLIYLGSIILLANISQCDVKWDKVYVLLSAKLDKIILDQDVMKQETKDLVTSVTAINQQVISLETRLNELENNVMKKEILDIKVTMTATNQQLVSFENRLSEVAFSSQQLTDIEKKLDNMDSHVKDVETATLLLRRGMAQEKTASQSRSEKINVQIMKLGQEFEGSINSTRNLSARVDILDNKHDIINSEVDVLADTIHKKLNETGMQISELEHAMIVTLNNASGLFEMFGSLEKTQSDIKSEIEQASEKTRAQIATVQQNVVTTLRNTQTIQSRVDTIERTQSDLQSKTRTIEGQISRLQYVTGTFVGFSTDLSIKNSYHPKNTIIKFDRVNYGEGNNYSPSTGIFTVPVSGVYAFMFNVQVGPYDDKDKHRRAHVVLKLNDNDKAEAIVISAGADLTGGNAAVLKVWAGDRVYVSTAGLQERYYIWPYRTSFSGALLHVI